MPQVQESSFRIYINAPPEFVFDYLADPRNLGEWSPRGAKVELESAETIGLGARFHLSWVAGVGRGTPHPGVVTESQRPWHLVFVLRDEYFEDVLEVFSLKRLEGGTLLQRRVSTSMNLVHALLARILIAPLVQPLYENSLPLLKRALESRARGQRRRLA